MSSVLEPVDHLSRDVQKTVMCNNLKISVSAGVTSLGGVGTLGVVKTMTVRR